MINFFMWHLTFSSLQKIFIINIQNSFVPMKYEREIDNKDVL